MVRSPAPSSSMDGEHPAPSFAKGAQAMTDINNSVEPIRPSLPGISNTVKAISASLALLQGAGRIHVPFLDGLFGR